MTKAHPPDSDPLKDAAQPATHRGLRLLIGASCVLIAAAFVTYLVALIPGTGRVLSSIWPWLFAALFPILFIAVPVVSHPPPRKQGWLRTRFTEGQEPFRWVRPTVKRPLAVLGVLVVANFVVFGVTMPDNPHEQDGQYYIDVLGVPTPVSAARYDAIERTVTRGFTGHVILLAAVAAALVDGELRRRSAHSAGVDWPPDVMPDDIGLGPH